MYKISWSRPEDKYHKTFVLAPDVYSMWRAYWVITGYGRGDGSTPTDVTVTNLDGDVIDMDKGLASAASYGTYSTRH